jgi:murein DD-endopeptidase MepM/ murein hydrolase activator NlpD
LRSWRARERTAAATLIATLVCAFANDVLAKAGDEQPPQIFPVRGPHGTRGPVGDFGAPRSGGRTHEGFDIVAACGTPLVAARGGKVLQNDFDPVLDGNEILIHARGTGRNYRYSHLLKPAIPSVGEVVRTGQRIGSVGKTGNAITVGCHLHFEMRIHGRAVDPEPALRKWDGWS